MSNNTLQEPQSNPVEQVGLSPEENQTAIRLKSAVDIEQRYYDNDKYLSNQLKEWLKQDAEDDASLYIDLGDVVLDSALENVVNKHFINKSVRAAKKHYKKHEVAYEEQAEIEATRAGKEIHR